eukprot:scaffold80876_cov34-Prasinocladus_malaysianus.AAC.3
MHDSSDRACNGLNVVVCCVASRCCRQVNAAKGVLLVVPQLHDDNLVKKYALAAVAVDLPPGRAATSDAQPDHPSTASNSNRQGSNASAAARLSTSTAGVDSSTA